MNKSILILLFPYKVVEATLHLHEVDYFKIFAEVQAWDLSNIINPQFAESISAKYSDREEVIHLKSLKEFIQRLSEIRKKSYNMKICILNDVTFGTLRQFLCNLLLAIILNKRNVILFDMYIGGQPLKYDQKEDEFKLIKFRIFVSKAINFFSSQTSLMEFKKRITYLILNKISLVMPNIYTHRLVAGDQWRLIALRESKKKIKIVNGHCQDFSNYLLSLKVSNLVNKPASKKAVFLSSVGPVSKGDGVFLGRKDYRSSEVWYPALATFFTKIEQQTGVVVEIAGHYKATYDVTAPKFKGRQVRFGHTNEMIRDCEFVIAISSTAVSYAVIYRKPIIFIYSNELEKDELTILAVNNMSKILGTVPVNIDSFPSDLVNLLKVDEERYQNYEKSFLTSDITRRPNAQIILEDIMGINTDAYFDKLNRINDVVNRPISLVNIK